MPPTGLHALEHPANPLIDTLAGKTSKVDAEFHAAGFGPEFEIGPDQFAPLYLRRFADAAHEAALAASLNEHGQLVVGTVSGRTVGGKYIGLDCYTRAKCQFAAGKPLRVRQALGVLTEADERKYIQASGVGKPRHRLDLALLLAGYMKATGVTQEAAANDFGLSAPTVCRILKILKLPDEILRDLEAGLVSGNAVVALSAIKDPDRQLEVYRAAKAAGDVSAAAIRKRIAPKRGKPGRFEEFKAAGLTLSYPADWNAARLIDALKQLLVAIAQRMKSLDKSALPASTVAGVGEEMAAILQ